jgi:hypothetical protein
MKKRLLAAVLCSAAAMPAFAAQTLAAETNLVKNQYLSTRSGLYTLVMQSDGNVVLYFNPPGYPTRTGNYSIGRGFATGTHNGDHLRMQMDGQLALYTASNTWAWWSDTGGNPYDMSYTLVLRETGALEIWKKGTYWKTLAQADRAPNGYYSVARFPFKTVVNGMCQDGSTPPVGSGMLANIWAGQHNGYIGYCNSQY